MGILIYGDRHLNCEDLMSKSETISKYECSNVKNKSDFAINNAQNPFWSLEFWYSNLFRIYYTLVCIELDKRKNLHRR